MNMRSLFLLSMLLAATSASAFRTGNTMGRATSCNGCHLTGTPPTLEVTQVTADPLAVGASAVFKIRMVSQNAGGAGRFGGFAASVTSDAGTFIASTAAGAETEACPTGNACPAGKTATRDVTRRAFAADGSFEWNIELTDLKAGTFSLAVGVNDVNNNGFSSGDRNAGTTLSFTVAEGEGEGEPAGEGEGEPAGEGEGEPAEGEGDAAEGEGDGGEGEGEGETGGCAATGVSSSSVALLLALGALRRRRR